MADKIEHHHISPNGLHPVHVIGPARVDDANPGDVVGYPEEIVSELLAKQQPSGKGPVVERAVRVLMKKEVPHWRPEHNPKLKTGSMPAVPPAFAKGLVSDGHAEYVTPAHDAAEIARQKTADGEHYRRLSESMQAQMGTAPTQAKRA